MERRRTMLQHAMQLEAPRTGDGGEVMDVLHRIAKAERDRV
jgi:hypothetical protein